MFRVSVKAKATHLVKQFSITFIRACKPLFLGALYYLTSCCYFCLYKAKLNVFFLVRSVGKLVVALTLIQR
jgi:hypothetical protein